MEPTVVEHDDSDTEEDPTRLLNQWLGELNTLKRVSLALPCYSVFIFRLTVDFYITCALE
jgi:hypothetical protein